MKQTRAPKINPKQKPEPKQAETLNLKLLIALCFPDKRKNLEDMLAKGNCHNITVHLADGIAKTSMANLLGFSDSRRIMMTAYVDDKDVVPLFEILNTEFYDEPGNGIAFTINIDAYGGAKSMIAIDTIIRNFEEGEKNGK